MKKKFVKSIALGLVTVMAATSMLAGCGKSDSSSGDEKGDGQVTLTFPVWDLSTTPMLQ